jgi:hypothetical protein
MIKAIYNPNEFYFDRSDDPYKPAQRAALILIGATSGIGEVRVAFVGEYIIIATVAPQTHELDLVVRELDEFVESYTKQLSIEMEKGSFDELMDEIAL